MSFDPTITWLNIQSSPVLGVWLRVEACEYVGDSALCRLTFEVMRGRQRSARAARHMICLGASRPWRVAGGRRVDRRVRPHCLGGVARQAWQAMTRGAVEAAPRRAGRVQFCHLGPV